MIHGRYDYQGDTETYDDLANANLIQVIRAPARLASDPGHFVAALRARRWLGGARVDFPGHFLIALEGGGQPLVLDVFNGGTPLDARGLRGGVETNRRRGRRIAPWPVAADAHPRGVAAAAKQHPIAAFPGRSAGGGAGDLARHAASGRPTPPACGAKLQC